MGILPSTWHQKALIECLLYLAKPAARRAGFRRGSRFGTAVYGTILKNEMDNPLGETTTKARKL